ncbi:uncharacterized protein LOC134724540 [Mytilus trossulus]|uniref:uncharacterized protein LOC134724540 n=1 Tax=Mytilus trossulus TaxID=6551 RepID=UPI003006EB27
MNIIDREKHKEFSSLLLQCKQYLRTDFKVHIAANSEVGDHCLMYALSDSIHPQFAHPCQHQHNLVCVTCEQLKDATLSIQKLLECTNIVGENEKLNDMILKSSNPFKVSII